MRESIKTKERKKRGELNRILGLPSHPVVWAVLVVLKIILSYKELMVRAHSKMI